MQGQARECREYRYVRRNLTSRRLCLPLQSRTSQTPWILRCLQKVPRHLPRFQPPQICCSRGTSLVSICRETERVRDSQRNRGHCWQPREWLEQRILADYDTRLRGDEDRTYRLRTYGLTSFRSSLPIRLELYLLRRQLIRAFEVIGLRLPRGLLVKRLVRRACALIGAGLHG